MHAQNVTYHGSKHYNIRVNQFKQEGSLPDKAIVMLGDSHSEYGKDWNRFFPNASKIINRGIIGDDSRGISKRLNQILPYNPSKIFFECGTNDLSHGWTVDCNDNNLVFIDLYHPLLGVNAKEMHADYCRDGLHLSNKGYEVWANIIRSYINE